MSCTSRRRYTQSSGGLVFAERWAWSSWKLRSLVFCVDVCKVNGGLVYCSSRHTTSSKYPASISMSVCACAWTLIDAYSCHNKPATVGKLSTTSNLISTGWYICVLVDYNVGRCRRCQHRYRICDTFFYQTGDVLKSWRLCDKFILQYLQNSHVNRHSFCARKAV